MKRETKKVAAERTSVRELGSEELRCVLGGQNVPVIRVTPPEDGYTTGRDYYADPGCQYK
jgi:hypothetical protein